MHAIGKATICRKAAFGKSRSAQEARTKKIIAHASIILAGSLAKIKNGIQKPG
jgi:hypothetical protein